ncbi:MAG: glycosyltransferase [Candidatus Nanopelagicales bacterium]
MRVLVVTVVHHPEDARILHREIAALKAAGHEVSYAAPFTAYGVTAPEYLRTTDLPRAVGRDRLGAVRAAGRLLRREAPKHDVVLLHDPELLLPAWRLPRPPRGPVVVWDVHEDTAAAVTLKPWLPGPLRAPTAAGFRGVERAAERRFPLLLAEDGYLPRFVGDPPVVPNSTYVPAVVPPPGRDRVVYVGHLSEKRGALDLVEMGRLLRGTGVTVEVAGHADSVVSDALASADADGDLRWHGYLPNDEALSRVEGSLAGLSLLHDEPNYRHSRPTKVIEYMARGVPVVTTPTPPARALVEGAGCGVVVPFRQPAVAADEVLRLRDDPQRAADLGRRGHEAAQRDHDWGRDGAVFVAALEEWVAGAERA